MQPFNQLLAEVRNNQNKQYSKEVEDATFKTLAERYKTIMGVRHKNSCKHHHHVLPEDLDDEEEDEEDSSIIPEDELSLLVNAAMMEQV
jgi:hypothetical protein